MKFRILTLGLLLALPVAALAASSSVSNYKMVHTVSSPDITTPTTVRVEVPYSYISSGQYFSGDIAKVVDAKTGKDVKILYSTHQGPVFTAENEFGINADALFDKKYDSTFRLEGPISEIRFNSNDVTTISNISLNPSPSNFPSGLVLQAELNSEYDSFLNKTLIKDPSYISVTGKPSESYMLRLYHNQPLELSEIEIGVLNAVEKEFISWTAKPGSDYSVYLGLGGQTESTYGVNYDSLETEEELTLALNGGKLNSAFVDPDDDKDGVSNMLDNCLFGKNPNQEDANNNQIGDACEDFDEDSILGYEDNCPADNNPDQQDTDDDGLGNACDDYENRITERLPFLPWLAIIGAALVMGYVIYSNLKKPTPLK